MERVTITMSDELAAELSDFMTSYRYDNRSEALRDLARLGMKRARIDHSLTGQCLATLTYVFNHYTRELATRLTEKHHAHHELHVATMHVHLDHENCLEVAILRGEAAAAREFAKEVIAERGVKHGQVTFIPVTVESSVHAHEGAPRAHSQVHSHSHPRE